jgi:hypothetical protein
MPRAISYEMEMMFVGSEGAFDQTKNTGQYLSRIDFVQSYDFSFNVERQALKQIGSGTFASRQSQLAPDVDLNISYLLNDGWNEKYIGFDFVQNQYSNPLQTIFSSTGDRNFYVLIAQDETRDANAATSVSNYNVLGIGNSYMVNYEISVAVNQLATVSCSFQGANANIQNYSTSTFLPAVNTFDKGQIAQTNKRFGLVFLDNSRSSRNLTGFAKVFDSGCSYQDCQITATPTYAASALRFGLDLENFQSMSVSIPIERKPLYGFGSNHPKTRKVQKPVVGTFNVSSIVDSFSAENLATTFAAEDVTISGYNFDILFQKNANKKKFGIKIQNARLDSYSIGSQIGDKSVISTNWSFEINEGTGILFSGSYGTPTQSAIYINESINP